MSGSAAYRDLAARLADLTDQVNAMSTSQLGHSSLENRPLRTYDEAGQLTAMYGRLPDGTFGTASLAGPTPPTPTGITATPTLAGLIIGWGGEFEALPDPIEPNTRPTPQVAPLDWLRLEILVGTSIGELGLQIPRTSIESPRGGEVTPGVSYDTDYYVAARTRSTSGKVSAMSQVLGPLRALKASVEDLDIDFELLRGTQVYFSTEEPVTDKADLWVKLPENIAYRYDPDAADWIMVRDQGIVQALQDAQAANSQAAQAGVDALAAGQSARDALAAAQTSSGQANEALTAAQQAAAKAEQAKTDAASAAGLATLAKSTADGKATVYFQASPPTGLVAGDVNDLWIDSDDSNKTYRWSGTAWVASDDARIAQALTTAGSAATVAGNAATAAGTAQTTANSKVTVFAQDEPPTTTGRTTGDLWIDTNDANKIYAWSGSWVLRPFGAGAIAATARQLGAITTFKQASPPTGGMILGDFWIDSDDGNKIYRYDGPEGWVASQDAAINTAITSAASALAVADGKARIFVQPSAPVGLVAGDVGDTWIDTDDSNVTYTWTGTAWEKRQLGSGAIQPKSLVASDVVATGTVSAALLEAIMVLVNQIIAGDPLGDHARMNNKGFRVFRAALTPGEAPDEVVRMGTDTNDFFAVVDSSGRLVASIDDVGRIIGQALVVQGDPIFMGTSFLTWLSGASGAGNNAPVTSGELMAARHYYGFVAGGSGASGIKGEYGIMEMSVYVSKDRMYQITPEVTYRRSTNDTELVLQISDGGADSPSIFSTNIWRRQFTNTRAPYEGVASSPGLWQPSYTGWHRIGMSAQRQGDENGIIDITDSQCFPTITVLDLGPAKPIVAGINRMGGSLPATASNPTPPPPPPPPPPPTRQYYVDLAFAGSNSYRGNGSRRDDVGRDVIQGWDPSGYNGDGKGYFYFNMPDITGTIDKMDVYFYTTHWFYNSGGTAVITPTSFGENVGSNYDRLREPWIVGGLGRGSAKTIDLPRDWWDLFKGVGHYPGRARGIALGPGGGTDYMRYGRFTDCRLRIYYTQ